MSEPDSKPTEAEAFVVQAELSPADAAEVREGLIAALTAAGEAKKPLAIEIEGEGSTPCAVQLLVAAKRSADAANVEMNLSQQADAMLAAVHAD